MLRRLAYLKPYLIWFGINYLLILFIFWMEPRNELYRNARAYVEHNLVEFNFLLYFNSNLIRFIQHNVTLVIIQLVLIFSLYEWLYRFKFKKAIRTTVLLLLHISLLAIGLIQNIYYNQLYGFQNYVLEHESYLQNEALTPKQRVIINRKLSGEAEFAINIFSNQKTMGTEPDQSITLEEEYIFTPIYKEQSLRFSRYEKATFKLIDPETEKIYKEGGENFGAWGITETYTLADTSVPILDKILVIEKDGFKPFRSEVRELTMNPFTRYANYFYVELEKE